MQNIRCAQCNKKLAEGRFIELSIKCPRCGALNHLKATSLQFDPDHGPDSGVADVHIPHHSLARR
ncbi:Com family DNA-binding transcriptional regulator [uncultured Deefgea sp.]|uniref:Com family DNA-binding transcriptional regulator n=1 Tax=uncultured Deefgea sp. TaxID=1304914 RepID=UPI002602DEF4|nr:Com family DNA-binding transcriptional regulator [uncultured Deefgea sp.]